ncbi:MAG: hypothetical protein KGZ80_12220 [Methylomonas sp.]|nr:hypothetical protein [Methylomonas sp.]PPD22411.1 MAG: hypothetical protein CTY23_02340 [Methylomonas sp.]PPD26182.1 MAG: hypothetical protein CTY22_05995 [Methylomonas sp.]PPD37899.1 MAG: hypothetical protein CTY21_05990 [Methylomonas sp.]PPD42097.1 MAG: hypothetical protein CTY17_02195 [Methylomonas sp.]
MAELVFIATTIFVAYVIFDVISKPKNQPATAAKKSQETVTTVNTAQTALPDQTINSNPSTPSDSLKNPKTGEIAKFPGNYAFAKRWIKDALVEEGLLEKVYKNNELDSTTLETIQKALQDLRAMEKYQ